MDNIVRLLVTWVITSISLFIISKLPTGVEIDGFNKALISAAVFGVLNALIKPVLEVLAFFPITLLTLGLFSIIINAIIFGLAAWLVTGFRLRWGFWSAIIGTLALSFINSILSAILGV
ncbi:MAG: phage holin family protein [Chroococcales cyanobacterium]